MKRIRFFGSFAALLLSACAASTPDVQAIENADKIDYRSLLEYRKNRTPELEAFLENTSFSVAMPGGRTEVYFASNGRAVIKDTRKGTVKNGMWQVKDRRWGDDNICWTEGVFPTPMAGAALVNLCRTTGEFVGVAFYLSRGNTFGLSAS